MSEEEFAAKLLIAASIRENSWVVRPMKGGSYTTPIESCVKLALGHFIPGNIDIDKVPFGRPMYLLLSYAWNDSINWAEGVLRK